MKNPFNQWKIKSGKGIWTEYVNEVTGESSIQNHTMKKVSKWDECDHYYELLENGSDIQCRKCGLGGKIVWGLKFLKDGKIIDKL